MANSRLNTPRKKTSQTVIDAALARKKVTILSNGMDTNERTHAIALGVALFEYNEDTTDVMMARDQLLKLINAHRRATKEFGKIANRTSCFALPDAMVDDAMQIEGIMASSEANIALLQRKVNVINLALEVSLGCWSESHDVDE